MQGKDDKQLVQPRRANWLHLACPLSPCVEQRLERADQRMVGASVRVSSSLLSIVLYISEGVHLYLRFPARVGQSLIAEGRQEFIENGHCRCMPGEDQDPNWGKARIIAKERNYVPAAKQLSGHFNVGTLLQMASGLDTMEVWLRINRGRDIERTRESLSPPNRFNAQQVMRKVYN